MGGERQPMLVVHQFSERHGVRFVADMPGAQRIELVKGCSRTRLRHFGETKIDRVGQYNGQQRRAILCRRSVPLMRKVASEMSPAINLEQQVRDLHVG